VRELGEVAAHGDGADAELAREVGDPHDAVPRQHRQQPGPAGLLQRALLPVVVHRASRTVTASRPVSPSAGSESRVSRAPQTSLSIGSSSGRSVTTGSTGGSQVSSAVPAPSSATTRAPPRRTVTSPASTRRTYGAGAGGSR